MSIRFNGNIANNLSQVISTLDYNAAYTAMGYLKVKVDTGVTQSAFALSPSTGNNSFDFFGPENTDLYVLATRLTDGIIESDTGPSVVIDIWIHWAVVRSAANLCKYYIDAVEQGQTTLDMTTRPAATICNVGRLTVNGSGFIPLDAETAYYRIWTTDLTLAEIATERTSKVAVKTTDLFGDYPMVNAASAGDDISGNGNHFTINGTISNGASEPPLGVGPSLFRGRSFPFFDDEQVNRFEFWPAVGAVTEHERTAALNAGGNVEVIGESFSVFERSAALDATAVITTSAQFFSISERSTALDGVGAVTVTGARVVERSASLSASASVETSATSFSVFERSSSVDATAQIATSAEFFSTLERSVTIDGAGAITVAGARVVDRSTSLSATASVESSATFFSVFERTTSLSAIASVEVAGSRVVERSVTLAAAAAIEVSAQFFSLFDRSVELNSASSVEVAGQFFSTLEGQVSVDGIATITVSGQTEQQRQVALTATADISVSGVVIPQGAVEFERSAALNAIGSVSTSAEFFSVVERAVSFSTAGNITVSGQSAMLRSTSLNCLGLISVAGEVVSLTPTTPPVIIIRQSGFAFPKTARSEFAATTNKTATFPDTTDVLFQ